MLSSVDHNTIFGWCYFFSNLQKNVQNHNWMLVNMQVWVSIGVSNLSELMAYMCCSYSHFQLSSEIHINAYLLMLFFLSIRCSCSFIQGSQSHLWEQISLSHCFGPASETHSVIEIINHPINSTLPVLLVEPIKFTSNRGKLISIFSKQEFSYGLKS